MATRKRNFRSTSIYRYRDKQFRLRAAGGVPEDLARETTNVQTTEWLMGSGRYIDLRRAVTSILESYRVSPSAHGMYIAAAEWIVKNVIVYRQHSDKFAMYFIKEKFPETVEIQGGKPLVAVLKYVGISDEVINNYLFEIQEEAERKTAAAENIAAAEETAGEIPRPQRAGV